VTELPVERVGSDVVSKVKSDSNGSPLGVLDELASHDCASEVRSGQDGHSKAAY